VPPRAHDRQADILRYVIDNGVSIGARGTQAHLGRQFGVAEATISRDIKAIFEWTGSSTENCCVVCGAYRDLPIELSEAL
jgi:hypothetical protein